MRKAQIALLISAFSLTPLSCSSIPEEAITLNQEILKEVGVIHDINKSLTDSFFNSKIEKIEEIENSSIRSYIALVSSELETNPLQSFGHQELESFYDGIKSIHDSSNIKKSEIVNQREASKKSLDEHFKLISEASTAITKILSSQAKIEYNSLNILKNLTSPLSPINITQE
ncbi:hypothetical protein [Hahella chejuensis]|nr:hypothetical protein [Hahella chejuensis]